MPSTKATTSKAKFEKIKSATETDDNLEEGLTRKKTIDFSTGGPSLTLSLFQLIALVLFIISVTWFVAAKWYFETKTITLKNELEQKFSEFKIDWEKNNTLKINNLDKQINDLNNQLSNLKIKNPYLK